MKRLLITMLLLGITSLAYCESGWRGDQAKNTDTDTTYFDGILSANETDVQQALDILDDISLSSGAPTDADYLVGTANGSLSAEIPVGTTPGGELGGSWATPTVDSTHSGSAHHAAATITTPDTNVTAGQAITFAQAGIMGITESADTITFTATEVDGSTSNEINTITCPDANVTAGLGITFADTGIMTITESGDTVTFDATEVDSIVGAVTGIVKSDGSANFSAASAGTDYQAAITGTDTHVMFFDGANTPAGDAGMTYNKTTDTLTIVDIVATDLYLTTSQGDIEFEGATPDDFETTLTVEDPTTPDKTITLPDATGTVVLKDTEDTLTNKTLAAANNVIEADTVLTITGLAPDTQNTYARTQYLIPYASTTTAFGEIAIGTATHVLTSNGIGSAPTFQAAAGGAPEGTAVLSTGPVADTNYLRADGDGTCSWQAVAGGGTMSTFILEDSDGTEVSISDAEEVKFIESGIIDIDWTDTDPGSDADPFDLTFTVTEVDSIVGAVSGVVESDGAGNISACENLTDVDYEEEVTAGSLADNTINDDDINWDDISNLAANGACTLAATATNIADNTGTTTTVLHGNAAGSPSFGSVVATDMGIDAYDLGTSLEADTLTESGNAVFNTTEVATFTGLTSSGIVNIDDGVGDSPSLFFFDADNNYFALIKYDAGAAGLFNNEGVIRLAPSNDINDYLEVSTAAGIVTITTIAGDDGDLVITAGGGDISFGDENISTTGTHSATGGYTGALTGNADSVTNATFTTALTVDTGTVGLTGNIAGSVLTLGAGANSFSGTASGTNTGGNTGDNTVATSGDSATDFFDAGEIIDARISDTLTSSTCTGNAATVTNGVYTTDFPLNQNTTGKADTAGNADTVTNATLTTALTVNTGAVTLIGNAGASTLTLGAGANSFSGTASGTNTGGNTGDDTVCTSGAATTAETLKTARAINGVDFNGSQAITVTAAEGTLTGATLKADELASSLTSLGTIASLVATTADINAGTVDATIGGTTPASGSFTEVVLSADGKLEFNPTPSATDKATGIIVSMTVDVNTVGIGGLLHLDTDSHWVDADMNATTSMPCMGIALGTTGTVDVLLNGIITDTAWTWTVGGIMYVNTAGTMTQTAPAGNGDQVQVVGIALTATTVYFNPSGVLVEVVV